MTHLARCSMCFEKMPISEIFDHLGTAHDVHPTIQTWPDGEPVIVDKTLEPEDFSGDE